MMGRAPAANLAPRYRPAANRYDKSRDDFGWMGAPPTAPLSTCSAIVCSCAASSAAHAPRLSSHGDGMALPVSGPEPCTRTRTGRCRGHPARFYTTGPRQRRSAFPWGGCSQAGLPQTPRHCGGSAGIGGEPSDGPGRQAGPASSRAGRRRRPRPADPRRRRPPAAHRGSGRGHLPQPRVAMRRDRGDAGDPRRRRRHRLHPGRVARQHGPHPAGVAWPTLLPAASPAARRRRHRRAAAGRQPGRGRRLAAVRGAV
jgi:hypothetical protein